MPRWHHALAVLALCPLLRAGAGRAQIVRLPDAEIIAPASESLAGPHPVGEYVAVALAQNPTIQAARQEVLARAYRVPQAASLQDPMLNVTTFPSPVQTAAGAQRLALGVTQKFPWRGKLVTAAAMAEADTNAARARLAAAEFEVIEQVKRAYYELYFAQFALELTTQSRKLLDDLADVARSRFRAGAVSQQHVLRAQLEVSKLDRDLIQLRQELVSARARLARLLHVSPETPLATLEVLPPGQPPADLQALYQRAVSARPELHAQLAEVMRSRRTVRLAELAYLPDPSVGVKWINTASSGLSMAANGQDPVMIGVGVNLPIYRRRLEAGVREAQAEAAASARRYDALRDMTLQEVKDLFAQAKSQQEIAALFRGAIVPQAEQTFQVSIRAYQVGEVSFLQLIDNWRQLLRFQLARRRVETQLRQTLATLERTVGGVLPGPQAEAVPALPAPTGE
jgi:outer membrane protein TolC